MNILVSGGAGFIGSHVVDEYIRAGHRVWVVDNESTGSKKNLNPKAKYSKVDITNARLLSPLFKQHHFDVVNHHASQVDVRLSVKDPIFDAKTNILGLLNLLQFSVESKVKKVIFSSSGGTVYGECPRPASENSPEKPLSPYGVSKLASEKYIQAFHSLYGLRYTIFRYANVYGPRQDPHGEAGVVAIFSNNLLSLRPSYIFGRGNQIRDFVFVKDVARANKMALSKADNQIINIGTGKETSVNKLFAEMAKSINPREKPLRKPARAGELRKSVLDIKKAKRVLGWEPKNSLSQGLAETLFYFKNKIS